MTSSDPRDAYRQLPPYPGGFGLPPIWRLRWWILAPALHQRLELPPTNVNQMEYHNGPWGAFEKLAKKSCLGVERVAEADAWLFFQDISAASDLERKEEKKSLSTLPTEILDHVLNSLSTEAAVTLGMCSKGLWNVFLRYMRADMSMRAGCWAGTPLCVSTVSKQGQFSDLVTCNTRELSKEEGSQEWIQRAKKLICEGEEIYTEEFTTWAKYRDRKGVLSEDFTAWSTVLGNRLDEQNTIPSDLRRRMKGALRMQRRVPTGEGWLLRNLTKRQVVRLRMRVNGDLRSQFAARLYVECETGDWLRLDTVLLGSICLCWWLPPEPDDRSATWVGEWAGDCFDVVEGGPEKGWVDVTDRLEEVMSALIGPMYSGDE